MASASASAGIVAATDRRLVLPVADEVHAIGWDNVERARWDRDSGQLIVVETAPVGARHPQHRVGLSDATSLLDVIREQVKASVVISRHVPIVGERGARVSGRRRPGQQQVSWVVALDRGIDLDDADVRSRVDAAVSAVRAEVE